MIEAQIWNLFLQAYAWLVAGASEEFVLEWFKQKLEEIE